MKYKRFIIENYKGISKAMEINLENNNLVPIIGINECGKTTILNAIFAFDHYNDEDNVLYNHLSDVANLYSDSPEICKISAIIELNLKVIQFLHY